MKPIQTIPYLSFDCNCAEAMETYARILGGSLSIMTYEEMPLDPQMPEIPEDTRQLVAHAELRIDGRPLLMGSDVVAGFCAEDAGYQKPQGMRVLIHTDDVQEGGRIFNALAEGGQVEMAFAPVCWAEGFGTLTDRFGTPWHIDAGSDCQVI